MKAGIQKRGCKPASPDRPIPFTPALKALIQRVSERFQRPDVQLLAAVVRKLRTEAEGGAVRSKRRWMAFAKKPAPQGFSDLAEWFKRVAPIRGRGDEGYMASDDEVLTQVFSEVEAGLHASPNAALRSFVASKRFGGGGTPDSIVRRIKRRPQYKAMMRLRRQQGDK